MCLGVLPAHTSVYHLHAWFLQGSTKCHQQSPWPKQQDSIPTVDAGLLQMAKLNQHNPQEAWVFFPAGRNVQLQHKWKIALTFHELCLPCWLKAASTKLFVYILELALIQNMPVGSKSALRSKSVGGQKSVSFSSPWKELSTGEVGAACSVSDRPPETEEA